MSYAKNINFPILLLIDKALDDKNKNNVMQVQLLSVLRVLYFKTKPVHLKNKSETFSLFGSQNLINCLSKGMTRDYYFVRENYINFTNECLPLFKRIMDDEKGKKTYYKRSYSKGKAPFNSSPLTGEPKATLNHEPLTKEPAVPLNP